MNATIYNTKWASFKQKSYKEPDLKLNEKRSKWKKEQSKYANTKMLELLYKHFKADIIKIFKWTIVNALEHKETIKNRKFQYKNF